MSRLTFRPARIDESEVLNEITLSGVRFYTDPPTPPLAIEGLAAQLEQGNPSEVLHVAEERGEIAGFYGLVPEQDWVELLRMFLTVDRIGRGYGRELWDHAVGEASKMSSRLKIISDPGAVGFYLAMGARLDKHMEVAPGFSLGLMWMDLA